MPTGYDYLTRLMERDADRSVPDLIADQVLTAEDIARGAVIEDVRLIRAVEVSRAEVDTAWNAYLKERGVSPEDTTFADFERWFTGWIPQEG